MFTVADFLALPQVAAARPEVIVGEDFDKRSVRWAHTSEIYDIAPLLKGGEVLLTTGLGLVGASPEATRAYISGLARVGLAALVLELGRTFPHPPADAIDEARLAGLPLVALHGVVPFIEITEAVHTRLLGADVARLRDEATMRNRMVTLLTANPGVAAFTGAIAAELEVPVALRDASGEIVAGTAVDEGGANVAVVVKGVEWGRLEAAPGEGVADALAAAAPLVALE
ncbi:PucR family transcriptional regulator ligand-binding domain-containing protein, partial [Microbacterium sp.]|uniref:PucR family transcriptional regulator ligand-binding domain-containing protein n=1 Tax=Microbacterium sp. TaxID=51671 RepID=UPI003C70D822